MYTMKKDPVLRICWVDPLGADLFAACVSMLPCPPGLRWLVVAPSSVATSLPSSLPWRVHAVAPDASWQDAVSALLQQHEETGVECAQVVMGWTPAADASLHGAFLRSGDLAWEEVVPCSGGDRPVGSFWVRAEPGAAHTPPRKHPVPAGRGAGSVRTYEDLVRVCCGAPSRAEVRLGRGSAGALAVSRLSRLDLSQCTLFEVDGPFSFPGGGKMVGSCRFLTKGGRRSFDGGVIALPSAVYIDAVVTA